MARILVVDDEINLLELIKYTLEKDGHRVITAMDGKEGCRLLEREVPDLIILDVMMPKLDGLEFCRRLRSKPDTNRLPIIMVSAKGETIDHIVGLEMGADDYLSKPFSPRELASRVKANLRHLQYQRNKSPQILKVGNIVLDLDKIKTTVNEELVDLTPKEFKLLKILMSNPGKVFTREVLLDQIWGINTMIDTRTVDVHIRYIRQKIEKNPANPDYILTVRGVGYKFREI
ncbi:response regulator transcription factor [Desulfotomaculum sp. 1211_IL3151]|uniref:response regulator transcription factor n=1 Tax=Desulfotomaculum sp. 1211_IL3151 TaxID=3084055 RepID=UPI002FDA5942